MNVREALEKEMESWAGGSESATIKATIVSLSIYLAPAIKAALWATAEAMAEKRRHDIPEHGESVDMAACVDIGIAKLAEGV